MKNLTGKADLDSTAEVRLQALLKELDRFEEQEEEADDSSAEDIEYGGPRRRWSDD